MVNMGVSKNRGVSPKMDGENDGTPLKKYDLAVPLFLETSISCYLQSFIHPRW